MLERMEFGGIDASEVEDYEVVAESTSSTSTLTITGKSGKTLLVLLYTWSSAAIPYTRYDNATITGGTLTKLTNVTTSNTYTGGTWFVVDVTSNECVISHTVVFAYKVFEAVVGV